MSDSNQNIRVVLGPVARSLIPSGTDSRQDALDAAITKLMQSGSVRPENHPADVGSSRIATPGDGEMRDAMLGLQDEVRRMSRAMTEMKEIALAEMRMTRLLVGTLVDQSNEDHVALLRFAGEMIQKMYANSELLTKEDRQDLERKEDLFLRMNRMELERSPEPEKDRAKQEEIVR